MADDDLREDIARLEAQIERLAATIEGCRKIVLAAKAAIVIGGLLIGAMMLGVIRFDPLTMIGALIAVIGGTVLYGSNTSTANQATVAMQEAETERAALIGSLDLRPVDTPESRVPRLLH
jgi:uncharacterized protein YacL